MKSEPFTITAAELARYHAGAMSHAEMHMLEKAALSDPFLADALEGYGSSDAPVEDMADLRLNLARRTGRSKAVTFFSGNNAVWRVAAMIVLFAGLGYVFYRLNDTGNQQQNLATNQEKAPELSPLANKGSESAVKSPAEDSVLSVKPDPVFIYPQAKTKDENISSEPAPAPLSQAVRETGDLSGYLKSTQNNGNQNSAPYLVEGNITDNQGKPVEGAIVNISSNNAAAVTDAAGQFQVNTDNAVANASVSSEGFSSRKVQLNSGDQNNIALDKTKAKLLPPAEMKERADDNLQMKRALSKKEVTTQNTRGRMEPIDSAIFIDYVEDSVKEVLMAPGRPYRGQTLLSFNVNRLGRPENIKVDSSLCKACDEQAIELLKNGPKWLNPSRTNRRRVAVEF